MVRRGWMVRVGPVGEWLGRMTPGGTERAGLRPVPRASNAGGAAWCGGAGWCPAGRNAGRGLDGAGLGGMVPGRAGQSPAGRAGRRVGRWADGRRLVRVGRVWAGVSPQGAERVPPDFPLSPPGFGARGDTPARARPRPRFHPPPGDTSPTPTERGPGDTSPTPTERGPGGTRPACGSAGPSAPRPCPPPAAGAAARRHLAHPDGARTWRHPASLRERGADGTPPLRLPAPAPLRRRSGGAPLTCDPSRERFVSRGPPPSRR